MPIAMRKLEADEAVRAFPRRGQMDLAEYADALRGLRAGDAVAVKLADLSSGALKRRFSWRPSSLAIGLPGHGRSATRSCTCGSSRYRWTAASGAGDLENQEQSRQEPGSLRFSIEARGSKDASWRIRAHGESLLSVCSRRQ
jgi:hypothetical protein